MYTNNWVDFLQFIYGEDWEMWVRIAANFPVAHSPKPLALYRIHKNNITSRSFLSGQSITDIKKVIDIIQEYLPEEDKKSVKKYAKKHFSKYFARMSDKIYHDHKHPEIAISTGRTLRENGFEQYHSILPV